MVRYNAESDLSVIEFKTQQEINAARQRKTEQQLDNLRKRVEHIKNRNTYSPKKRSLV